MKPDALSMDFKRNNVMTRTELLEMIKNGENSGTEFKRDTLDNRSLAKEIVAFANLYGGRILLGVDDEGSIAGVTRPNLEEWVMTACRDKICPEIIPLIDSYQEAVTRCESGVIKKGLPLQPLFFVSKI